MRRRWRSGTSLRWLDLGDDVIAFRRENGWTSVTNLGTRPVDLPDGTVVLSSADLDDGRLPAEATAWLLLEDGTTA